MITATDEQAADLGRELLTAWEVNPEWWRVHLPYPVVWKIVEIEEAAT